MVVHNISLPPGCYGGDQVERLFTNRLTAGEHPFLDGLLDARVSTHFFIERTGSCTQFVSCLQRAWHAGASEFRGRPRCNDYSIGIELEGTDFEAFAEGAIPRAESSARRARRRVPDQGDRRTQRHCD